MGDLLGSPRVAPLYQLPPVQYPNTSQIVTPQGRGRGGRGFVRGSSQASTSQQEGRGQPRIFTLTQRNAQAPNVVEVTPDGQGVAEDQQRGGAHVRDRS